MPDNYQCKVSSLETYESALPFLPMKYPNGTIHISFALTDLINLGALKLTYIGSNQNVRGIPVNEWQGCSYSNFEKTTTRITISYSGGFKSRRVEECKNLRLQNLDGRKWTPATFVEDFRTVPVQVLFETKSPALSQIQISTASITRFKPYIDLKSPVTSEYLVFGAILKHWIINFCNYLYTDSIWLLLPGSKKHKTVARNSESFLHV